jgi:hypothetical protein
VYGKGTLDTLNNTTLNAGNRTQVVVKYLCVRVSTSFGNGICRAAAKLATGDVSDVSEISASALLDPALAVNSLFPRCKSPEKL